MQLLLSSRYIQKFDCGGRFAKVSSPACYAAMKRCGLDLFTFLIVSISGWMNQHQHQVIEYLVEENRVLREQIGNRRIRFTDNQRRRLARSSHRRKQ